VITGSGRAFWAGGDLTATRERAEMDPPGGQQFLIDFAALLDSLQNFPKPRVTPAHDTDEGVDMTADIPAASPRESRATPPTQVVRLMPSTPFPSPQVVSRTFASFRVVNIRVSAGQRDFCTGFDSRRLHKLIAGLCRPWAVGSMRAAQSGTSPPEIAGCRA
jgi:hypothetical protein